MRLSAKAAGKIAADNQEVDIRKQRVDSRVSFVEVGNDGNAGGARPLCGLGSRRGVVTIYEQSASIDDPFALEFTRLKREPLVAVSDSSAFAFGVNQDERLLASATWNRDEPCVDACAVELIAVNLCGGVVSELADIASTNAPALAGDHRGCYLPTRQNSDRMRFYLCAAGWILRH